MRKGRVVSVNVSENRGTPKSDVGSRKVVAGFGLEGDAHGGDWHRQVSLLARESMERMKRAGTMAEPGLFGENLTTEGVDLVGLQVGDRLEVGKDVVLEVTQVRKSQDDPTAVYFMEKCWRLPLDVIFATVVEEGTVSRGDPVMVVAAGSSDG